jgi:hypothetical protein
MSPISLNRQQVNPWRLTQQHLLQRADQAQLMSTAELSLFARMDGISPEDVQQALWQVRTLIKTWAMRGTLHLISASEFPLYVAARSDV